MLYITPVRGVMHQLVYIYDCVLKEGIYRSINTEL